MSYKTINTKYITIFFGAFLIGGLLHVALYGIDFFDCISQMYYSALALVWAVTIQKRVSDRRIRNRLLVTLILMDVVMNWCFFIMKNSGTPATKIATFFGLKSFNLLLLGM